MSIGLFINSKWAFFVLWIVVIFMNKVMSQLIGITLAGVTTHNG